MKKFKRIATLCTAAACTAALALGLAACGNNQDDDRLQIVALSAGYGDEWISDIAEKYSAETGVEVKLTAEYDAKSIISSHMASRNNPDDLYICTDTAWKTYAAQGKFLDLSDLLEEEVDGVKVSEKVNDEYADSIYYTDQNGTRHCYRLPWTSGVGGIYYNAAMFEANPSWKIPTTFQELLDLCETIVNARIPVEGDRTATVKPFVFTGQNQDYFDYTVFTWWAQLAGTDAIDQFLQYSDSSSFATKSIDGSDLDNTYSKLKQATEYWSQLITDEYCVADCIGKSNHVAQQNFVNGYAAMMFNGDWLYNEILGYQSSGVGTDNFELGIMNTPTVPDAQYTNVSYTVGEDQFIAIPASSNMKEAAKDFIKYIISDDGISTFLNKAHGILAYKSSTEIQTDDTFMQSLLNFRSTYSDTFTNFSDNLMYLSNVIDIWAIGSLRPYNAIYQGTQTVDEAFDSIQSTTAQNWTRWEESVGL